MANEVREPTDDELRQAYKEEMGREPTAKELEEFKTQAMEGLEDGEVSLPTDKEYREMFKEEKGREPTAKELNEYKTEVNKNVGSAADQIGKMADDIMKDLPTGTDTITDEELKEAYKEENNGREPTTQELNEFRAAMEKPGGGPFDMFGGLEEGPTDAELKAAFKEEMGREPTAKELEEFAEQAEAGGPEGEATMPSQEEIR